MRPSDSNECARCPGHGTIHLDGAITLKLCQRCWLDWISSAVRGACQKQIHAFLATGYAEAAPRQIREEAP
jgi:hypothetical protein